MGSVNHEVRLDMVVVAKDVLPLPSGEVATGLGPAALVDSPGAGSGGLFSGGDPEEESTRNNPDNTTAAALATSFAWQNPTMEIVLGWLEAALYLVLKAIFYLAHLYFNY